MPLGSVLNLFLLWPDLRNHAFQVLQTIFNVHSILSSVLLRLLPHVRTCTSMPVLLIASIQGSTCGSHDRCCIQSKVQRCTEWAAASSSNRCYSSTHAVYTNVHANNTVRTDTSILHGFCTIRAVGLCAARHHCPSHSTVQKATRD
jgi:hypothetical protein